MKVGDLIVLTPPCVRPPDYEAYGIIVGIYGHKAEVLFDGELKTWDISDLEKMREWYENW